MAIHNRLVTVYHGQQGAYCVVEEIVTSHGVVDSRWHNHLTERSLMRMARTVAKHALACRPFLGGCVGYVAEMPACVVD